MKQLPISSQPLGFSLLKDCYQNLVAIQESTCAAKCSNTLPMLYGTVEDVYLSRDENGRNISRTIPHRFLHFTRSNSYFWTNSNLVRNTKYQIRKWNGNDLSVFSPTVFYFSLFIRNIPFLKFSLCRFWPTRSSALEKLYLFHTISDEDDFYIKIVALHEIYIFLVFSFFI